MDKNPHLDSVKKVELDTPINKDEKSIKKDTKNKKPVSKVKKIFNWIFGVLTVLIVGFSLVFGIVSISSKKSNYGVPNFFGTQVMVVLTDSMEPEYEVNGAVVVKKVPVEEIKVNDDITFFYDGLVITHRVREIWKGSDNLTWFKTSGINTASNQGPDPNVPIDLTKNYQEFNESVLLGKVDHYNKSLGEFFKFMTDGYILIFAVGLPCGYLVVVSIIDIIKAVYSKDDEDDEENNKTPKGGSGGNKPKGLEGLSEEEINKLKQDLLRKLLEQKQQELNKKGSN